MSAPTGEDVTATERVDGGCTESIDGTADGFYCRAGSGLPDVLLRRLDRLKAALDA